MKLNKFTIGGFPYLKKAVLTPKEQSSRYWGDYTIALSPCLWPQVLLALVVVIFCAAFAHAGPREQVAVAEAFVFACQNARPGLPADTFQAVPKSDGETLGKIQQSLRETHENPHTAIPGSEIKVNICDGDNCLVGRGTILRSYGNISEISVDAALVKGRDIRSVTIEYGFITSYCGTFLKYSDDGSEAIYQVDGNLEKAEVSPTPIDGRSENEPKVVLARGGVPPTKTEVPSQALPGVERYPNVIGGGFSQGMRIEIPAGVPVGEPALLAQLVIEMWESGCRHCERQERDIKRLLIPRGWSCGEDASCQIRFVVIPQNGPAPQAVLYQSGVEIRRWQGYQDPAMLSNELRRAWDASESMPKVAMAAYGSAGTIHAKQQIRQAITYFRQYVGDGNTASLVWGRNGSTGISLIHNGDWSAKSLFGTDGRIELSAPSAINLPTKEFAFDYRIRGSDLIVDADPITLRGMADKLSPSSPKSFGATPVGILGIDDALFVWSVVSMIRDVSSLLWPSVDLTLPDQINASAKLDGDSLVVTFDNGPSIRIVFLFTFSLKVKRVTINESRVLLEFTGSRFVKSREFEVR